MAEQRIRKGWKEQMERIRQFLKSFETYAIYTLLLVFLILYISQMICPDLKKFHEYIFPIGVVAALYIIMKITLSLQKRLESSPEVKCYENLFSAKEALLSIIEQFSNKGVKIKVIEDACGLSWNLIRGEVLANPNLRNFDFRLLMIDPYLPNIHRFARHWRGEIRENLRQIESYAERSEVKARDISIRFAHFRHMPIIKGWMIGENHLFIGFDEWIKGAQGQRELSGAEKPYFYYLNSGGEEKTFFDIFKNWFNEEWFIIECSSVLVANPHPMSVINDIKVTINQTLTNITDFEMEMIYDASKLEVYQCASELGDVDIRVNNEKINLRTPLNFLKEKMTSRNSYLSVKFRLTENCGQLEKPIYLVIKPKDFKVRIDKDGSQSIISLLERNSITERITIREGIIDFV